MKPIRKFKAHCVVLPVDNIDTDQIIPARFLKTISRQGLGKHLFAGWRYDADGKPRPDFPLNHVSKRGALVLIAGDNFGSGSSREHAPWALTDFGFRAVVSTSFADIFCSNALKNSLIPVRVDKAFHRRLLQAPPPTLTIDVEKLTVTLPDGAQCTFPLEKFARYCLLEGKDELGFLLEHEEDIAAHESR